MHRDLSNSPVECLQINAFNHARHMLPLPVMKDRLNTHIIQDVLDVERFLIDPHCKNSGQLAQQPWEHLLRDVTRSVRIELGPCLFELPEFFSRNSTRVSRALVHVRKALENQGDELFPYFR